MDYHRIDVQIGWVREFSREENSNSPVHYHIGIIADGSKTQSAVRHAKYLGKLWSRHLGIPEEENHVSYSPPKLNQEGLCAVETASAIKIRRDSPYFDEQFTNAFNWLSYQAKNVNKKNGPYRSRCYGFTLCHDTKTHPTNENKASYGLKIGTHNNQIQK